MDLTIGQQTAIGVRRRCGRDHVGLGAEVCLAGADLGEWESAWGDATRQEENALTTSKSKR